MAQDVAVYETADASFLADQPSQELDKASGVRREGWKWNDLRSHLETRLMMLRSWRLSWIKHWALLAQYILPRRNLWLAEGGIDQPVPNSMVRGLPINQSIIDPTGTQAMRICAAGLMSGLMSPSRPWFKFRPAIKNFEIDRDAQLWFDDVEERVYAVMAESNFYDSVAQMFEDLVVFGTAPVLIYEDKSDIIRCYNPVCGDYSLAVGATLRVESFFRMFTQTVAQTVEMFGLENCPPDIQGMWANKGSSLEVERIIAHSIEPNFPVRPLGGREDIGVIKGDFTYREHYWVWGVACDYPLSQRGFKDEPFICPRWAVTSNDAYGRSPGMDNLPDIMQLQQETVRKAELLEKHVRPPLNAPAELKNQPSSILPGRVTYVADPTKGMTPVFKVDPGAYQYITADLKEIQLRIKAGFFNDLFLMISGDDKTNRTAYEIAQRQQEKLQVLGPVIERAQNEAGAPAIKRVVNVLGRKNLLPPMPASLQGVPLEIEFVSMLAIAQRTAQTASMERTIQVAAQMAPAFPGQNPLDNIDPDEFIRTYGDGVTVPQKIFVDPQMVKKKRAQQAQAAQQAQQAAGARDMATEVAPALAGTAETLANTDVGGGISALSLMSGLGGSPQQGAA